MKMTMKVELDQDEIKKAIIEYVKREKNIDIKSVTLTHHPEFRGEIGSYEHVTATASE